MGTKLICYSLWGSRPIYTFGAIINVMNVPKYYPGWYVRIYYGTSVPEEIITILKQYEYVQLVAMNEPGDRRGMFWRFHAASDPSVDVMISRDADSRISAMEAAAVDVWLRSDKGFHTMRDNRAHGTGIMGGMWGAKKGVLPQMSELIDAYKKGDFWQVDQNFLRTEILPLVKSNMLEHDPIHSKPFPLPRQGNHFVGEVITDDYHRVLQLHPHLSIWVNGSLRVMTRGGFGNILFNVLMGESLAKRLNMRVDYIKCHTGAIDRPDLSKYKVFTKNGGLGLSILEYPPANMSPEEHQDVYVAEQQWTYYSLDGLIKNATNNYLIDGYFQSYKHYPRSVVEDLRDRMYLLIQTEKLRSILVGYRLSNKKLIALHVRRGDYLKSPNYHPVPGDKYYKTALDNYFVDCKKNYKILVFSDDVKYIREWSMLKEYDYEIVDLPDVEEAFWMMMNCDHYIIANSTLSLLSYYFRYDPNQEAVLCIPSKWFGPLGPKYKLDDLVELTDNVHVIESS